MVHGRSSNTGAANNGLPQYVYSNHAQSYQYAKFGLITAGPLQGTAFDAAGNPHPFLYGSNGVPVKNAARGTKATALPA